MSQDQDTDRQRLLRLIHKSPIIDGNIQILKFRDITFQSLDICIFSCKNAINAELYTDEIIQVIVIIKTKT